MKTKDFFKHEWLMWLFILAPLVLIAARWNDYPDKIPTHWNAKGEVDDYGGKWAVFLSPMINAGTYLLLLLLPKIDPRKKNYALFSGTYRIFRLSLAFLFSLLGFVTCLFSLGYHINVGLIIQLAVVGLFFILGNQFGRIRPNYFIGIRTPWTLNNEDVWMRTHRFAGKIWVISSLVMAVLILVIPGKWSGAAFILYVIVIAFIPVFYSWKIHQQLAKENPNAGNS